MKRKLASATVAAALSAFISTAPPAHAAEKMIYATFFADFYAGSKADIWFMEQVEKRSGGEIKFERYWNQALLRAPDLMPGLRSGAADIVNSSASIYNIKEYPLANVMMPYLTTRGDAVMKAWRDLYKNNKDIRNEFESKGAKLLYAFAWAENSVWTKKPITKSDDFKGLKVRAVPPIAEPIRKLGATPVALAWAEGIEALQRGVVDGIGSTPFDSAVHAGMHEVAKYGNDFGGTGIYAIGAIAISLARYNKLSEKHRKIIDEVAAEMPEQAAKALNASVDAAVDKLCAAKDKLVVSKFSDADKKKIYEIAGVGLQQDWLKRVKAETKVDGKALLDEFVGYIRKYEKDSTYVPGFERYEKKCGQK
ncbi:MAG: TRAP transporter substrate-binding protein DctP [Hyphomicrobiaceae bacterium]